MKVQIELELTERELRLLLQNSLERVMNNAIYVGTTVEDHTKGHISERASTLWQDCEELKPLTVKLWCTAQEAVRRG